MPAYTTCTSPETRSIGYATYVFQIYARDAAGNTSAVQTRTFQNQYFGLH